jgi:hypothetical protein
VTDPPDLSSWALVSVNNFDSGATPVIDAVPHALLSLRNRVMRSIKSLGAGTAVQSPSDDTKALGGQKC